MSALAAPRQLVLDLGHRTAFGAEDFLLGHSNAAAVALVDAWPDWPGAAALVVGPPRSGKTHLAHVWQHRTGAGILAATELNETAVTRLLPGASIVVEDIDLGFASEAALFHLMNLAREHRGSLLMTSTVPAGELSVALPDLRSRLRAAVMVEIAPPDDGLLAAVLVKHFTDRQLLVDPQVISWLVAHMERTMAAAAAVVAGIDRLALATRRKVTRTLAAEALANLDAGVEPVASDPADSARG
ncbi:MAG: DnaA/Hda family protein [Hyphomicrobiaceae bacterium]|nr:DnaA/Hda family protein [Hyphomicrobiaceae bacterium]